jgi:sortase A
MTSRLRTILVGALIVAGSAQLAWVAVALIRSSMLEREARVAEGVPVSPWSLQRAAHTRNEARPGHRIGHLEIRRLGLRAAVVEGIDSHALLSGVGHVPHTAFPGEPDNTALAGHRDTHFAPLQRIVPGDSIRIATADGVFVYQVDSAFIVTPDRADLMGPTGRASLTLITCYPFRWIGPAPRRFIVRAHGLATSPAPASVPRDRRGVAAITVSRASLRSRASRRRVASRRGCDRTAGSRAA